MIDLFHLYTSYNFILTTQQSGTNLWWHPIACVPGVPVNPKVQTNSTEVGKMTTVSPVSRWRPRRQHARCFWAQIRP